MLGGHDGKMEDFSPAENTEKRPGMISPEAAAPAESEPNLSYLRFLL
jgi:hypothetical protein